MIVGDLVILNHHMVRKDATDGLVETAADGAFRNFKIRPRFSSARVQLGQRLFEKVQRGRGGVCLEVSSGAIAFDGVAPLGNFPLELDFGKRLSFWQVNFDAVASGFDVADIHDSRECRGPEASDGSAAGVQSQVITCTLVQPPRRHNPGVLTREIALLRPRYRRLIPRVVLIHWIPERVGLDECFRVLPFVVVRTAQQDANVQINVNQIVGHQLPINHHSGSHEHSAAPLGHILVGVVADVWVVERSPASQQNTASPDFFISRKRFVEEVEQIVV